MRTFYTIQISQWRLIKDSPIEFLDITVKSGLKIFAPSWEILNAYQDAGKSDTAKKIYTEQFYQKMRESFKMNSNIWYRWMTNDKPIALACYCRAGEFCHRCLMVDIWQTISKQAGLDLEYGGEITPENYQILINNHL